VKYSDHLLFTLGVAALLSVVLVPDGVAQRRQDIHAQSSVRGPTQRGGASALSRRAARQARLHALRGTLPGRSVDPTLVSYAVVVQPAGRGFHDLQDALDFCGRQDSTRGTTILLAAGTYTGNFVLPTSGITIVGQDGPHVTWIVGQPGVMQPTIRYSPSGGTSFSYAELYNLTLVGEEVAAVEYGGSNADAMLWLDHCRVETGKAIPAIRMSGGGFASSSPLTLDLEFVAIESQGDGIQASIGAFTLIFCGKSFVAGQGTALDVQASYTLETELVLYDGAATGGRSIVANGVGHVWSGMSYLEAANGIVTLTDVPDAGLERGELHAAGGDAVHATNSYLFADYLYFSVEDPLRYGIRAVSGSTAEVSYCRFSTGAMANAISVDGSSTKNTIFNHWRYTLLP